ncbi:WYL domain-containing protein [Adlercreutzia caecimuris]|uniref:WYL domain-containing protein n=1 Tax=Adlercreutzia caecimuris TaxID=671266 RepID=UPI0034E2C612
MERFDASFSHDRGAGSTTGRISFYTSDLRFAADAFFGVLDKVRVIAPEELRETVRARLENASSLYEQ